MPLNYIRKDTLSKVPIQGGELILSPGYDVIHHFEPLGAMMLKYWNTEGNTMCNVMIQPSSGLFLMEHCGLSIVDRPFILASEHEALISWQAEQMTDRDFGL